MNVFKSLCKLIASFGKTVLKKAKNVVLELDYYSVVILTEWIKFYKIVTFADVLWMQTYHF